MGGFPGDSDGKESACNAGGSGLVPGQKDSLEKAMATHSSILAWRIPWTEEPGGLQFMRSQRVRHDSVTNTQNTDISDGTTTQQVYPSLPLKG